MKKKTLLIEDPMLDRIKKLSNRLGLTVNSFIRMIIMNELNKIESEENIIYSMK